MRTVVGGIIGAVVGFVVGGPMGAVVGAGLGAGLGAMATPVKVQGAKVGEEERASVQSGTPIGIILGEGGIKGDLLWQGPRTIVKVKEEQEGKGGGTTVENEEVQRDYAIHFCESNARRGTKIRSVKIVRRNNIIVYDTRPESRLSGADNGLFMQNVRFYFGDADQEADPTYEAHFGHLGAPAYRNQFTMVVRQHLLGKFGNAIPTYEVVTCGEPFEGEEEPGNPESFLLVAGSPTSPGGPTMAAVAVASGLTFVGIPQSTGATLQGAAVAWHNGSWIVHSMGSAQALVSIDDRNTFTPFTTDRACYGYLAAGPSGLLVNGSGPLGGYDLIGKADPIGSTVSSYLFASTYPGSTPYIPYGQANETYMCCWDGVDSYWMDTAAQGHLIRTNDLSLTTHQIVFKRTSEENHIFLFVKKFVVDNCHYATLADGTLRKSPDGGATWSAPLISVTPGGNMPLYMKVGNDILLVLSRDSSIVWSSADNFATQRLTGIGGSISGTPPIIAGWGRSEMMEYLDGKFYIVASSNVIEPANGDCGVETVAGITFSDPVPTGLVGVTGIVGNQGGSVVVPDLTEDDVEFPDATGHYVDKYHGTYSGRDTAYHVEPEHDCSMSLAALIQILSKRTPVPPEILDTSRVEAIRVRGVSFRVTGPVRNAIDTLAELYQFDVVDSGGGITIVPRGGPIDVVVEDGDILLSSKDVTKKKRGQQSEFPKIATLRYVDPTQSFEESSQRSVIKSKDFRATGEKTFTVSVTMSPDEAATQIARIHAEMQDQLEGGIQFDLPLKYLAVIPSCVISYLGKRYRVTKRRVEPWKIIVDSAVYDRASTYSLTAEGTVTGHTPTPQSGLVGPTMFAPMNMPVAIDAYDRPCLHAVVQGVSPGWRGADIYIKRGTGPYELTVSNMSPGVMGELTDSINALSARGIDYGQTLKFKLYANGEAESITFDQLLQEKNAFALVKPDYTTSIGQFMDATEVDSQMYEATGLAWNGLDTSPGSFAPGTLIAFLDRVQMIPLRTSDLGQTIKVKAVSRGSAVEAAPEHTITLTTMESLREWQPYFVKETWSETGVCLSWIGRARLGTSRAPLHSQYFEGYTVRLVVGAVSFEVDTSNQELCISAATLASHFGPDYPHPTITVRARSRVPTDGDTGGHDSPPAPGPVTPPSIGGNGGPASTHTGTNGGFPDNGPPLYPFPTTFDEPLLPDPGFDSPTTIQRWRKQDGSPLGPEWTQVDGKLKFQGSQGIHRAYDYGSRFGMSPQPFPRLSVQTDADVQNSIGVKSRIGVAWGLWSVGYVPSYLEASGTDGVGESYLTESPVTHTWLNEIMRTGGGVNVPGQYAALNFMPVVEHVVEYGYGTGSATVDNFDMQIALIDPPVTAETPYNLDLSHGMDGISLFPDPGDTNEFVPDISVSGGVMTATFHHDEGVFRWVVWDDPFVNADAVDKFCKLMWEGWSNDTTVRTNNTGNFYPIGGVCAGLSFRSPDGTQETFSLAGLVERGDFTPRVGYHHIPIDTVATGYTVHAAMLFVGHTGFQAKMRNYTAASTNDPYPETP